MFNKKGSSFLVICAQQRSGTTVLQKTLAKNTAFYNYGEIFHHQRNQDSHSFFYFFKNVYQQNSSINSLSFLSKQELEKVFYSYLDYIKSINSARISIIDIKYNSWHHLNPIWHNIIEDPFLLYLIKKRNIPVIHIVRNNKLDQYISMNIATRLKKFHFTSNHEVENEKYKLQSFDIDIDDLMRFCELSWQTTKLYRTWLSSHNDHLEFIYEEMFDENFNYKQETIDKISEICRISNKIDKTTALIKPKFDKNRLINNLARIRSQYNSSLIKH